MRFLFSVLLYTAFLFLSCDGAFPTRSKEFVPADHTRNLVGALHAAGNGEPLGRGACSDCHGADLKGGVVDADGGKTVAPSCYECHGALWEGGGEEGGEREDD